MKKLVASILLGVTLIGSLVGCGSSKGETAAKNESAGSNDGYSIGILQFAEHGSLDNCREGFIEGLKRSGIEEGVNLTIDYQNAQADPGLASQISSMFVSNKVDLIGAVATPAAQSAYNAALDTQIPTIFTAVTDPVEAALVKEGMVPVGNVTGTSDKLPVEEQLKMIRKVLPEAKTIGILYTTSEANSISTIEEYKALAGEYGFELEVMGVSSMAEVPMATDAILNKVDCLNNLTDNTVVNSLPMILEKANGKNIPVFGSEVEQVKMGCVAAVGIDYYELGIKTGEMAAQVLKGEKTAEELPCEVISDNYLYINETAMNDLGINVSDDVLNEAKEVFK